MILHRALRAGVAVALAALLAACGRDAMAPDSLESDELLLAALDEAAAEANRRGDADAGSAYSGAAMAFRLGIRPTAIDVTVGDATERYLAFVHLMVHNRSSGPSYRLRTMVAVHGDRRPERILYVATLADSAGLGRPTMDLARRADFMQLAWAAWKDLEGRELWVGVGGKAGIEQTDTGGECPALSERARLDCTLAKFSVMLDGEFKRVSVDTRQVDATSSLAIATRAGDVNGALLTY